MSKSLKNLESVHGGWLFSLGAASSPNIISFLSYALRNDICLPDSIVFDLFSLYTTTLFFKLVFKMYRIENESFLCTFH